MNDFSITKTGLFFYASYNEELHPRIKDGSMGHAIKWTPGSLVVFRKEGYRGTGSSLYQGASIIDGGQ